MKPLPVVDQAVLSLTQRVEFFDKHGVFGNYKLGAFEEFRNEIPLNVIERIVRAHAKSFKRPFIELTQWCTLGEWVSQSGRLKQKMYEFPVFSCGELTVPRRNYLLTHVSNLFLTASTEKGSLVEDSSGPTIFHVIIRDEDLWKATVDNILYNPELRAARRTPPLDPADKAI